MGERKKRVTEPFPSFLKQAKTSFSQVYLMIDQVKVIPANLFKVTLNARRKSFNFIIRRLGVLMPILSTVFNYRVRLYGQRLGTSLNN